MSATLLLRAQDDEDVVAHTGWLAFAGTILTNSLVIIPLQLITLTVIALYRDYHQRPCYRIMFSMGVLELIYLVTSNLLELRDQLLHLLSPTLAAAVLEIGTLRICTWLHYLGCR